MTEETVKVLLVEDDEDDFILTSELLEEIKGVNYEVTWEARYQDARGAMNSCSFDICLVDYRLGEGDGISLIREARASGCQKPIILLTGQGDPDVDLAANAAGAADYLVKGEIDSQLLERAIRYAIANAKVTASLAESEIRFRSVIESATDAIVLTDADGVIISWNQGAETIFGYLACEILGMPISTIFPADCPDIHITSPDAGPFTSAELLHPAASAAETLGLKNDGTTLPLEISVSSWKTPAGTYYSRIIRDVTERKSLEDQLTHQALHDPLTKLPNRVLFKNRVEHALSRRRSFDIAVLFIDLDNFKTVNDTLGHSAGDSLLIAVAERLEACLRLSDTAARLGGDEFGVLIEDTTGLKDGSLIAERILEVLKKPVELNGKDVFIGASIGIAVSSKLASTPSALLRNADVAMYTAKSQGKNRYALFEGEMHRALIKRSELENDLRTALDRGEFELVYQPIMSLDSSRIVAMEALLTLEPSTWTCGQSR